MNTETCGYDAQKTNLCNWSISFVVRLLRDMLQDHLSLQ